MSNSINTNVGAMVALASLRTTQAALQVASKQVQSGYRVADAMDDASTFSVAQGIRGNLQAFQAVQGSCQCRLNFPHYCRSKFPQSSGRLVFSV